MIDILDLDTATPTDIARIIPSLTTEDHGLLWHQETPDGWVLYCPQCGRVLCLSSAGQLIEISQGVVQFNGVQWLIGTHHWSSDPRLSVDAECIGGDWNDPS